MLEPQLYPELVAKALVLDEEPFVAMIDDDNPWVEGLALTTVVGVIAGAAQAVGRLADCGKPADPTALQNALEAGLANWRDTTNLAPRRGERPGRAGLERRCRPPPATAAAGQLFFAAGRDAGPAAAVVALLWLCRLRHGARRRRRRLA